MLFQWNLMLSSSLRFLRFSNGVDKLISGNAHMNLRYRDECMEMRVKYKKFFYLSIVCCAVVILLNMIWLLVENHYNCIFVVFVYDTSRKGNSFE